MPFLVILAIVVAVKYGLKLHALWEEAENKRIYHKPLPNYPSSPGYRPETTRPETEVERLARRAMEDREGGRV